MVAAAKQRPDRNRKRNNIYYNIHQTLYYVRILMIY